MQRVLSHGAFVVTDFSSLLPAELKEVVTIQRTEHRGIRVSDPSSKLIYSYMIL